MVKTDGPVIFDCVVTKEENCFPMIPSGAAHNDMLLADDQGLEVEVSDEGKALV
jgi:acetolactate synthase-1/2/3 large subunit